MCKCVEVAKGHHVEVCENLPTRRQKGLQVGGFSWRKNMEGEKLGGEMVSSQDSGAA